MASNTRSIKFLSIKRRPRFFPFVHIDIEGDDGQERYLVAMRIPETIGGGLLLALTDFTFSKVEAARMLHAARRKAGELLADAHRVDADVVAREYRDLRKTSP